MHFSIQQGLLETRAALIVCSSIKKRWRRASSASTTDCARRCFVVGHALCGFCPRPSLSAVSDVWSDETDVAVVQAIVFSDVTEVMCVRGDTCERFSHLLPRLIICGLLFDEKKAISVTFRRGSRLLLSGASCVVCCQRSRLLGWHTTVVVRSSLTRVCRSLCINTTQMSGQRSLLLLVFSSSFSFSYIIISTFSATICTDGVTVFDPLFRRLFFPPPSFLSHLCSYYVPTILWYLFVYIYPSVDSCIDKWVDSRVLWQLCTGFDVWGWPLQKGEVRERRTLGQCRCISRIVVPYFFTIHESHQMSAVWCCLCNGFLGTWRYDVKTKYCIWSKTCELAMRGLLPAE